MVGVILGWKEMVDAHPSGDEQSGGDALLPPGDTPHSAPDPPDLDKSCGVTCGGGGEQEMGGGVGVVPVDTLAP